mmetsp:Transcript_15915/g.34553  ORF Transcript_15915/g.34553 Transcript_15915/m.34553 type:complete len:88 (+) Transcript_15915:237-500(+)
MRARRGIEIHDHILLSTNILSPRRGIKLHGPAGSKLEAIGIALHHAVQDSLAASSLHASTVGAHQSACQNKGDDESRSLHDKDEEFL